MNTNSITKQDAEQTLLRLLTVAPLIRPAQFLNTSQVFVQQFKDATEMFRSRNYSSAWSQFDQISSTQLGAPRGLWIISIANAAACALLIGRETYVVEKLTPLHKGGELYGLPLWNLAVAFYRLGNVSEALDATKAWIARDNERRRDRQGKGYLVCACFSILLGNRSDANSYLERAFRLTPALVSDQLVEELEKPGLAKDGPELSRIADPHLLDLLQPKRPTRSPDLARYLDSEEIDLYSLALEFMAEGDVGNAKSIFDDLHAGHSDAVVLISALASCELFQGRYDAARVILEDARRKGFSLPGVALWNLACIYVRESRLPEAESALRACAQTEYRTSPKLWEAITILSGNDKSSVAEAPSLYNRKPHSQSELVIGLSGDVNSRRIYILRRLIKARRIPRTFRPDLARLRQRERNSIVLIIETAANSDVSAALSMFRTLLEQYPKLYTVLVNVAACECLVGRYTQAIDILERASRIQSLDGHSRFNLAYSHLMEESYTAVARVLQDGSNSSLVTQHNYWLALSVALAISGQDPSIPAGRALSQAIGSSSRKIVRDALKVAEIKPELNVSTIDPNVDAAERALKALKEGGRDRAISEVFPTGAPDFRKIPEIGPIFRPEIKTRPTRWHTSAQKLQFIRALDFYTPDTYGEAAQILRVLYGQARTDEVALNLSAVYLNLEEPAQARRVTRRKIERIRSPKFVTPFVYNQALADYALGNPERAVNLLKRYVGIVRNLHIKKNINRLLVGLLLTLGERDTYADVLRISLDEIRSTVPEPSAGLLLALAWAQLRSSTAENHEAAVSTLETISKFQSRNLIPAAEVLSMNRIRTAYDSFMSSGEHEQCIAYMETVIDARIRHRLTTDGMSERELEQNIGVEHVARVCLIRTVHLVEGNSDRLGSELFHAESLIDEYRNSLPSGFLAKDWAELAEVAWSTGFYQAAFRYCNEGLSAEPSNEGLETLRAKIEPHINLALEQSSVDCCKDLMDSLGEKGFWTVDGSGLQTLTQYAPKAVERLKTIGVEIMHRDVDELVDQAVEFARIEMSNEVYSVFEELVSRIVQLKMSISSSSYIEFDSYDEMIWPRIDDEREASCLFSLSSTKDLLGVVVTEAISEQIIWKGDLKKGEAQYIRYTYFSVEGFFSDSYMELPVTIQAGQDVANIVIGLTVGSEDPTWPVYPTGALSPEELFGTELYGRKPLIRQLLRSLGKSRSQATYFLQGPRQMGKTSLLYFLRDQAPAHVFPVYVNLERSWSHNEPANVWNYLVQRLLETANSKAAFDQLKSYSANDLVVSVSAIRESIGFEYVLFLLDELHFLFEKADSPGDILAEFREFLNNSSNRVAVILSDRYTRDELMQRCPSEYWAQLSVLNVGPLDFDSVKLAINNPTRGTDVSFLETTIRRIYNLTNGYPYHIQRVAQMVLENNFSGPWLTAIPHDVDEIVQSLLEKDILFQAGLCRPDRIDDNLAFAVAALLERHDLIQLIQSLGNDVPRGAHPYPEWTPTVESFLAHFENAGQLQTRLVEIGVLANDRESFFSPLLLSWLLQRRERAQVLTQSETINHWQVFELGDGDVFDSKAWQNLDGELVRRSGYKGLPPLKEQATMSDEWLAMVRKVNGKFEFRGFVDVLYRLFIDGRENKESLPHYPWLFLVYHRIRLVRNWLVHDSKSRNALIAWNQVTSRALGGKRHAYMPVSSTEWRSLQILMLRNLHVALVNSIEIAGTSL